MSVITHYMAHDPISNTEGMVTDFDQDLISEASHNGIIFIAVDSNGERSVVPADEVRPPQNQDQSFIIVEPEYVDDRMKAVVAVFDSLEETMAATPMALAATPMALAEERNTENPTLTFTQALATLKAIVFGDAEGEE